MADTKVDEKPVEAPAEVVTPADPVAPEPVEDSLPTADAVLPSKDSPVEVEMPEGSGVHVTLHLDRDLNDPRNAEPTPSLPSLNDEGQS